MKHRILAACGRRLRDRVARRPPDVCIGGDETPTGCYMARWHLLPRNRWCNLYLHHFQHSDDDRALHDHPYASASFLIEGAYFEHGQELFHQELDEGYDHDKPGAYMVPTLVAREAGELVLRGPSAAHRISLPRETPCWSLFATGPRVREWGFLCSKGWKHHQDFIDAGGCGEP